MGMQDANPRPTMSASMYFSYGAKKRPEVVSATTFDAILAGERTSTTRFPAWPGFANWTKLRAGERVRFYADRDMRGRFVDVIVDGVKVINLATCSADEIEEWSKAEGWTASEGRAYGRRYGAGVQIRYRVAA